MLEIHINMAQEMTAIACLPASPISIVIPCGKYLAFNIISNRMIAGTRIEIPQIELLPIRRGPDICEIQQHREINPIRCAKAKKRETNPNRCAKTEQMYTTSGRIARIAKVKPIIKQYLMLLGLNTAKARLTVSRLLGWMRVITEFGIIFEIFNGKSPGSI